VARPTPAAAFDRRVADVRRFSRFYTRQVGLLRDGYLASPFSLTEARVLYEVASREHAIAADLTKELGLDAGYLSRILAAFRRRGLIERRASAEDARRSELRLTKRGRGVFASLDAGSRDDIGAQLARLAVPDQSRLVGAMATVERLLSEPKSTTGAGYVLRPPRSGDYGWVVQRHGALYAEEYGWNEEFEGLVAGIVGKFVEHLDPTRERCWIAERGGENVGCVFAVKQSASVAKLRLLLVEPQARGLGIGKQLVDECIAFSRTAGYKKLRLWTNSVLRAARHLYEEAGFELVEEESHHSFGKDLVGETWELTL
jgi:DNA-binding MarR family transcriptional regulator/N-acetylglutamate synthase-like GNAT family acetyltransferase